ncbi:MAG: hypothetical protein ACRDPC_23225 [Solirubrobacteraceae bacterium]
MTAPRTVRAQPTASKPFVPPAHGRVVVAGRPPPPFLRRARVVVAGG